MSRILLIDGDMVAYRVAAAEEKGYEFEGVYTLVADPEQGRANLDAMLEFWVEKLEADAILLAFTAPNNYRKGVLSTYKSNRDGVRRPLILGEMRAHCVAKYETMERPTLEADDVLGIVATHPGILAEHDEKIIVTWDKDLRTVPGLHWNPTNGWKEAGKEQVPVIDKIGAKEAEIGFYSQVLSGDAVDGYAGCPGIGKKRALDIVRNGTFTFPEETVLKSGPNKGETRVKWKTKHLPDIWACIVSHYEKAGLTEEDALKAARVARILQALDYDFKNREPILWQPV